MVEQGRSQYQQQQQFIKVLNVPLQKVSNTLQATTNELEQGVWPEDQEDTLQTNYNSPGELLI